jgi:hypothetical protein
MPDSYKLFCNRCLRVLRARTSHAGRLARCPYCKSVMRLPEAGVLVIEQRLRHLAPARN